MTGRILSEQRRIEVEQCIARGWSTKHIAKVVGCTCVDVEKVRLRMDQINEMEDTVLMRPVTPNDAADELVTVYTQTVRDETARPLPKHWTEWERRRLAAAARRFRASTHHATEDTA